MKSTIDAIVGALMILGMGAAFTSFYQAVKTETVLKVEKGLPSLEGYTRKLTGKKLKY